VRHLAWWAGGVSILLLFAVPGWVVAARPERDIGSLAPLRRLSRAAPVEADLGRLRPPRVVVRSGLLADQAIPVRAGIPERLRIAAIDVDASIVSVGEQDGTAEVPVDVDQVGWYRFSGRLGSAGSIVLLAHVSSGRQGPGVFFRLRELFPGDDVVVRERDGPSFVFRVIARRAYAKDSLPDRLFRRAGPSMLALVTCGGRFSEATGRYEDNVVVYAIPSSEGRS
jgi:hypothetical protein